MLDRFAKLSWKMLVALMGIVIAQAVYIKTMTQNDEYSISLAREARALALDTQMRQNKVEVDVIKSVEGFRATLEGVKTEMRLLREEVKEGK